mgnify:CR=1 FL=1
MFALAIVHGTGDERSSIDYCATYATFADPAPALNAVFVQAVRSRAPVCAVIGGDGYQTNGRATTFAYPGDPVTEAFWSEESNDGSGTNNSPGDRRMMVHTGPFRLAPGEAEEVVFALPFAQGIDRFDSITELRQAALVTRNAWTTGVLLPVRVEAEPPASEHPVAIELERPRPNPFTFRLTVRYTLPEAMAVRVTLLDVLGRQVAVLASGEQQGGPHSAEVDTSDLPAGLYLVRVEAGTEVRAFAVVKAR